MTTDGIGAAVAAVHSHLTTPPPTASNPMASVNTDLPVVYNVTYMDKFDSRLSWYEDYLVGSFLVIIGEFMSL